MRQRNEAELRGEIRGVRILSSRDTTDKSRWQISMEGEGIDGLEGAYYLICI